MDRSIFEDSLLFHLNADLGRATSTEVATYDSLLNNMMEELPEQDVKKNPDLLIHINISFDTMLKRIKKRGRSFEQIEQDPSLFEYYKELDERYTDWYNNYDKSEKIQIDGDKYDFVENPAERGQVLQLIDEKNRNFIIFEKFSKIAYDTCNQSNATHLSRGVREIVAGENYQLEIPVC